MNIPTTPLDQLCLNQPAQISEIRGSADIRKRLLQLGFLEGSQVTIIHEAPFTKDPIGVRIHDTTIALRRSEASAVIVRIL